MEQLCHFMCSRGILKFCTFHSQKPISSNNSDTGYLLNMLKVGKMFDGMSIYVCSDLLKFFTNVILPHINYKFVLVSGDSDLCVPKEILTIKETITLLQNPYLLKWFVQNTRIQDNEKIVQMPIGLDYHTIANNPNCSWRLPEEKSLPRFQEEILFKIRHEMKPFYDRIPKIYVNFTKSSDRFGQRSKSLEIIPNNLLVKNNMFITPRTNNWKEMTKYTFILSPAGVGLDCHRTWEALCLGCIPIVCIPEFKNMFEDLPILVINTWNEVNEELLVNTIEEFKNRSFNYDKLTLNYWKERIMLKI